MNSITGTNKKDTHTLVGCGVFCILFLVALWFFLWPYQGLHYKYSNEYPVVKEHSLINLTENRVITQTFTSDNIHLKGIELYLIHNQETAAGSLQLAVLDHNNKTLANMEIPFADIANAEWHPNFFDLTLKKDMTYKLQLTAKALGKEIPQMVVIPNTDGNKQSRDCYLGEERVDGSILLSYDFSILESSYVNFVIFSFGFIAVIVFCILYLKCSGNRIISNFIDNHSNWNRNYKDVFVIVALILQFIVMIPNIIYRLGGLNLDPSWRWFLNIANKEGLKFGTDIYFTYGPLGYLCYLMNLDSSALYWIGVIIWLAIFSIHCLLIVWLYQLYKKKKVSFVAIILSVICYISLFSEPERDNYQLYLLILAVVIYFLGNKKAIIITNFMLSLMFFCKFSTFTSGVAFITIFIIFHFLFTKDKFGFLLMIPSFIVAPIAYFIYNPSLKGLYEYVTGILRISSGWMQTQQWNDAFTINEYKSMLFIIFFYLLLIAIVLKTDYRKSSILIACSVSLFFAYKYGVTAHGIAMSIWLTSLLFSVAMLSIDFDMLFHGIGIKKVYAVYFFGAILCCLIITALQAVNLHNNFGQLKESLKNKAATLLTLNESSLLPEIYENTYIPQTIIDRIGGETVTVYPWEVGYKAVYTDLNMVYSPSIQNCNEFIPWLDQKVADYFSSTESPEYIILEDETIYFHIKYLENPLTYEALKTNYDTEIVKDGFCLLKKDRIKSEKVLELISKEEYLLRDLIKCPENADYMKIYIEHTLAGKLKDFFWRTGMTYMTINYQDGTSDRGVVIVPNLISGFSLEYVPQNIDQVSKVFNEEEVTKMSSLQFEGIGLDVLNEKLTIEWYRYAD